MDDVGVNMKKENDTVMLHEIADVCIAPMHELKAQDLFIRHAFFEINHPNNICPGIIFETAFEGFSRLNSRDTGNYGTCSGPKTPKSVEIRLANGKSHKVEGQQKMNDPWSSNIFSSDALLKEQRLKISLKDEYIHDSGFMPEYLILELTDYIWDQFLAERCFRKAKKPAKCLWNTDRAQNDHGLIDFLKECKIENITLGRQVSLIFQELCRESQAQQREKSALRVLKNILYQHYNRSKWNELLSIAGREVVSLNGFMNLYSDLERDVTAKLAPIQIPLLMRMSISDEDSFLDSIESQTQLEEILRDIHAYEELLENRSPEKGGIVIQDNSSRWKSLQEIYKDFEREAAEFFIVGLEERRKFITKRLGENSYDNNLPMLRISQEMAYRISGVFRGFCERIAFLKLQQVFPAPGFIEELIYRRIEKEVVPATEAERARRNSGLKGAEELKKKRNVPDRVQNIKIILERMYEEEMKKRTGVAELPKLKIGAIRLKAAKEEAKNLENKLKEKYPERKIKPLSSSTMKNHGLTIEKLPFWK
jgi:hypothetical protein